MKKRLEQALHLGAAVVTVAAAFGLNPIAAAMLLAAISVGLAVSAGFRTESEKSHSGSPPHAGPAA
jgi:hypothetical protein